ncbi:MAG: hypothetical protein HYR49_04525 [Gammaproteobacteria bacterium]|nr:hypothetical protein [Gammaproteobacteria bacterium]
MMHLGFAGLVAAYVFIVLLLLSINLHSRWGWRAKAGATVAAAVFYLVTYLSIPELLGWPIRRDPPAKFRLHAAYVQQPDKLTKSKGAIYMWLTDTRDFAHNGPPRAFQLPYSAPMHEAVINATARINKGMPQMGEFRNPDDPNVTLLDDPTRAGQKSAQVAFFDIPDPLFPDK